MILSEEKKAQGCTSYSILSNFWENRSLRRRMRRADVSLDQLQFFPKGMENLKGRV
jgi:hypothetical protein